MAEHEDLGRLVRETWVKWASGQPDPKPSWLTGWDELDAGQREVDCRIGETVAAAERKRIRQAAQERLDLLGPDDFSVAAQTLADILLIVGDQP